MLKRIGKILAMSAAVLAGLALVLVSLVLLRWKRTFEAPYPQIEASTDPAVIAKGRYLAYGPGHCVGCHTDISLVEAVRAGAQPPLTGGWQFTLPLGTIVSPNLTPDPETGIGRRSARELARTLRYGVRHDGRAAMPFMEFHHLSDEDLTALVSFLKSQKPVRTNHPQTKLTFLGKTMMAFVIKPIGPKSEPPKVSPPSAPTVERGAYLANNVAGCATCHTKRSLLDGSYVAAKFSGGFALPLDEDPTMMMVTPNLTPDPKTGRIASWPEEQFVGRFKAGVGLKGTHMPWKQFSTMSTTDLQAIYRYLRTLEPVVNDPGPSLQKRQKS